MGQSEHSRGTETTSGAVPRIEQPGDGDEISSRSVRHRFRMLLVAVLVLTVIGITVPHFVNSRRFQVCGGLTRRVDTDHKMVALTFDDGPTPGDTEAVLDTLARHRIPATFFLVGSQVSDHPEEAEAIVRAGHQVGNHAWSHRRLIAVTPDRVSREVNDTDRALRAAGYRGEIVFRPPYGKKLLVLPCYLALHRRHTFTWDVSPETFEPGLIQTPQQIAAAVIAETRPGSIILLHPMNGRRQTQAALAPIIERLHADGYTFVTVDQLSRG